MILLIDNYDSFVHNLARYVEELGFACRVARNDAIGAQQALALRPGAVILSPGPCAPDEAGICLRLAAAVAARGDIPLLGVCLGHQAIAQALGGRVRPARRPMHGMQARILHDGSALFAGLPATFAAGRYHSLAADLAPDGELRETAWDEDGEVMAFAHRAAPVFGVQFHPESILSQHGHRLLANFLGCGGMRARRIPETAA